MGILDSIGSAIGGNLSGGIGKSSESFSGTKTTQKQLSQAGIDKIIYDILSSDQGLSALANAENASGGYKSSSKTLLAQDLIAKVAGEIANITAPTVETSSGSSSKKSSNIGAKTVICTYLAERGYINLGLYLRSAYHTSQLPVQTRIGYLWWAEPTVQLMRKHLWICKLLAPIATSRYLYVIYGRVTFWGLFSGWIGEPICYAIGSIIFLFDKELNDGDRITD